MKLTIKIKMLADIERPKITPNGDWIDLRAAESTEVGITPITFIPLGIATQLPAGCEAVMVSRSSTAKNFHIWNSGAIGVIDNSFNGDNDQWLYPATTIGSNRTMVHKNDRICQFRIRLSQKATMWQKLRWLFSSGVKLKFVDHLGNKDRHGIGSSGKR